MTAIIAQYVAFRTLQYEAKLAEMKDKEIKYESQHTGVLISP